MRPRYKQSGKAHILYDADRLDQIDSHYFDPGWWARRGALHGSATGRGTTAFIQHHSQRYVLRHYLRGGIAAHISHSHYLWCGLKRSRAWREWELLAAMQRHHLPVPPPVAVWVERRGRVGLSYRAAILMVQLEGSPLSVLLGAQPLDEATWGAVGSTIRRLHDVGVNHADLNAHNILINGAGEVSLIDFDRSRLHTGSGKAGWKQANLQRLLRSLRKLKTLSDNFCFQEQMWPLLLAGYQTKESAQASRRAR